MRFRIRQALPLLSLLLASCPPVSVERGGVPAAPDLEQAAIARGLIPDPDHSDIVGLYARDTDRVCVVADGLAYKVGASVDYGDNIGCTAAGEAARSGTTLSIDFGDDCRIAAKFEGDRLVFPAEVPRACAKRCTRRATFGALEVDRVSTLASEAATMRDAKGATPCGT